MTKNQYHFFSFKIIKMITESILENNDFTLDFEIIDFNSYKENFEIYIKRSVHTLFFLRIDNKKSEVAIRISLDTLEKYKYPRKTINFFVDLTKKIKFSIEKFSHEFSKIDYCEYFKNECDKEVDEVNQIIFKIRRIDC